MSINPGPATTVTSNVSDTTSSNFGSALAQETTSHQAGHQAMGFISRKRDSMIFKPCGIATITNISTSPRTWGVKTMAPCPFDAVRVHFYNHGPNAPIIQAAVSVTETADISTAANLSSPIVGGVDQSANIDSATTPYGWRRLTFGGGNPTGTMVAAASNMNPTVLSSDIIPLLSVERADVPGGNPMFMLRACHTNGATEGYSFVASIPATIATGDINNRGFVVQQYSGGGGGVLNLGAAIASAIDATSIPFAVEYFSTVSGHTLFCLGDSNTQMVGSAPEVYDNWGYRLAAELSTRSTPVLSVNSGASGATSAQYYATFVTQMAAFKPTVVICPLVTPNDYAPAGSINTLLAQIQAGRSRVTQIKAYCEQNNILPVFTTWLPNPSATGLTTAQLDAIRLAYNALRVLDPTLIVADTAGALANNARPQNFAAPYLLNDGQNLHFNGGAGSDLVVQVIKATLVGKL